MRVLGIDYGDRHIGLALSDPLLVTAQALGQYEPRSPEEDTDFFQELAEKYQVGEIVIGLPLRMDGTSGTRVEKTRKFGNWLQEVLNIEVHYWDERLTTKQAMAILNEDNKKMKKKKRFKDQISASLILSSYLESRVNSPYDPENT